MKKLNVIIEQGEDGFFAYVVEIEGCTAGGFTISEVKSNISEMIRLTFREDKKLQVKYAKGYILQFKLSLESVFKQFPELNIQALAKHSGIKHTILKAIADGSQMATEDEADAINSSIQALARRLQTIRLTK